MNSNIQHHSNYCEKYKNLKRKFKILLYENECFTEELRKAQAKLLKVSRDKSFLLDRLLQYEHVDESSDDSDATDLSDLDLESRHPPTNKLRKGKFISPMLPYLSDSGTISHLNTTVGKRKKKKLKPGRRVVRKLSEHESPDIQDDGVIKTEGLLKKSNNNSDDVSPSKDQEQIVGHMTRGELERVLEASSRRSSSMSASLTKVSSTLPTDIFGGDESASESEED